MKLKISFSFFLILAGFVISSCVAIKEEPKSATGSSSKYDFSIDTTLTAQTLGYSQFKVRITDKNTGASVPGLNVSAQPWMDMGTFKHATTVDKIVDNGDGSYTVTVYYLMASMMGMNWTIKVSVDGTDLGQSAAVPVDGTIVDKSQLKGSNGVDLINNPNGLGGTQNRTFNIFDDGSVTAGAAKIFLGTFDSYSSMPAVYVGKSLVGSAGTWTVTSVTITVVDQVAGNCVLTHVGTGHYDSSGCPGQTFPNPMTVSLTVNGDIKSQAGDGVAPTVTLSH